MGKSTLMNHLIGQKNRDYVRQTADYKETGFRPYIRMKGGQIIFLDTPVSTKQKNKLGNIWSALPSIR